MKFFVSYPFGVTEILKNKLNNSENNDESSIENANFIYTRVNAETYKKNKIESKPEFYKNALYVNNFKDFNGKICVTGDNCLANKYLFPKLAFNVLGYKKYMPKSYQFNNKQLINLKDIDYRYKYILKPENEWSRGGINIIQNYNDIDEWIKKNYQYQNWVLQKYVINPLLIDKKKFHFRIYILIVKRPSKIKLETYLFKEYFALCAPINYNYKSKDLTCHLTGAKYCNVHLVTNKLMEENDINFHKILPQFYEIAKDCGNISQKYIKPLYSYQTNYHLFAADVICDTNYQCHLLEVNNGGIGTEMDNLLPIMCPKGGSLHNTEVITKLFEDMIDIVLNKSNNLNIFENVSNSEKYKNTLIENFQNKQISLSFKVLSIILITIMLIILIFSNKIFGK